MFQEVTAVWLKNQVWTQLGQLNDSNNQKISHDYSDTKLCDYLAVDKTVELRDGAAYERKILRPSIWGTL